MPTISKEVPYNGAVERIRRLGLSELVYEVRQIVTGFELRVKEEKDANGGAAVRKLIDASFSRAEKWTKRQVGAVDWTKCVEINGARVCVGVEVQFSARSDLLVIDIIHLRAAIVSGQIDVGILVVADDLLGSYLTDRGPRFKDATRHIAAARADDLPLIVMALMHDGPGPALSKQPKRATR